MTRRNSQLIPSKAESNDKAGGFHISNKYESPERYYTLLHVSRQFGMEKSDRCNKFQDLSVHW
jgi:hypothetical protein